MKPWTIISVVAFVILLRVTSLAQFTNIPVAKLDSDQVETAIAISPFNSTRLLAGWNDYRKIGNDDSVKLGYAFSTNGGNTWLGDTVLIDNGGTIIHGGDPSVSFWKGDTAFYCHLRYPAKIGTIYLSRTTDLGLHWDLGTRISDDSLSDRPCMAIDSANGKIYVSWIMRKALKFAYSSDKGATFTKQTIDSSSSTVDAPIPAV